MDLERADDGQIIESVLDGDTNSFNRLVWRWEKPIYNYILRMVGNPDDALDLCQDSFMKAFRELGALKDVDRFSAWLYRIAHNVCYSRFRRNQGKTFVDLEAHTGATRMPMENRLAVEKALGNLPEEQREVVILKVYQGFKFDEIAAIQGAPVSTVKSRLYMGFDRLKSALGEGEAGSVSTARSRARSK